MTKLLKFLGLAVLLGAGFLAVRMVLLGRRSAEIEPRIGLENDRLKGCPDKPNCVSTSSPADDRRHAISPMLLPPDSDGQAAMVILEDLVRQIPKSRIITSQGGYLHAEVRSRTFDFVDDVEFYVRPGSNSVEMRSASRVGYSDLGANRKRIEGIRKRFAENHR